MRNFLFCGDTITQQPLTKLFVTIRSLILSLLIAALPGISNSQVTLICDNGGFENGFLNYFGFRSDFINGSSTCTPLYGGQPLNYIPVTMPSIHRFAIMTAGFDPVVNVTQNLDINHYC